MKVCVVGAGVVGCATAFELALAGHQVTLMDAAAGPGMGTSFANGAQLSYSYVEPLANPATLRALPKLLTDPASPVRFRLRADPHQWAWGARFLLACTRSAAQAGTGALLALGALSRQTLDGWVRDHGLAFSLHTDPQFARADDISVNFNANSWANPDNDRIYSTHRASPSRLDVAWVRTDHNERSGFGAIGSVSIVIVDVVVSLEHQFPVVIDSIQLVDRFGNKTAVAGDTLLITLLPDAITGSNEPGADNFRAWPNPVVDELHLRATEPISDAILYDATGREQAHLRPDKPDVDWPLPELPDGIYLVEIHSGGHVYMKKISFQ